MADEPFIANEDRPELSLDMDGKVGDLTVQGTRDHPWFRACCRCNQGG